MWGNEEKVRAGWEDLRFHISHLRFESFGFETPGGVAKLGGVDFGKWLVAKDLRNEEGGV